MLSQFIKQGDTTAKFCLGENGSIATNNICIIPQGVMTHSTMNNNDGRQDTNTGSGTTSGRRSRAVVAREGVAELKMAL